MALDRREVLIGLGAGSALVVFEAALGGAAQAGRAKPPFPELTLRGSAGAIGRVHGKAFAKQIKSNIGFYLRWFEQVIKLEPARALSVAARFTPVLKKYTPALFEEIEGIAKGAGVKREEILALNARTDLLVVGRQRKAKRAELDRDPELRRPGCTALALFGGSKRRPLLALGQNWDWRKDLKGNLVLLRVQRKGAPSLVTFTEAGMVGKIGFNAHRLGVCLNFLSHKSEQADGPLGLPVHVLLRAVMECKTLAEAYKLVAWAPRCASANFLLAQHSPGQEPRALDLEWTPSAIARLLPGASGLIHTNHYLDPALKGGCDSGLGRSTLNRYEMASRRAANLTRLVDPTVRLERILKDRQGAPLSVSKTATAKSRSQTLASVVMDLSRNRLRLCVGQPHLGRFVTRLGA